MRERQLFFVLEESCTCTNYGFIITRRLYMYRDLCIHDEAVICTAISLEGLQLRLQLPGNHGHGLSQPVFHPYSDWPGASRNLSDSAGGSGAHCLLCNRSARHADRQHNLKTPTERFCIVVVLPPTRPAPPRIRPSDRPRETAPASEPPASLRTLFLL